MMTKYKLTRNKVRYISDVLSSIDAINKNIPCEIKQNIIERSLLWDSNTINLSFCYCNNDFVCKICKYACCELALGAFCMCTQSTVCIKHGFICNGSHD